MTISLISAQTFFADLCFFLLLCLTILYWVGVTFSVLNHWKNRAHFGVCLANISLLILLCLRWKTTGHYPLSNLYESLLFLTWSVLTLQLTLERFVKIPVVGTITTPLALFLLGFALFSLPPDLRSSQPLVPALQSHWLLMHVTSMLVSYAALLIGSLFAIALLVLFPDEKGENEMLASTTNSNQQFEIRKSIKFKLPSFLQPFNGQLGQKDFNGKCKKVSEGALATALAAEPALLKDQEKPLTAEVFLESFWPGTAANAKCQLPNANCQMSIAKSQSTIKNPKRLQLQGEAKQKLFSSFSLANPSIVSTLAPIKQRVEQKKETLLDLSTKSSLKTTEFGNQYIGKDSSVLFISYNLDILSYRTLGIGFAFLTVGLLSGAVWANEAWGSYWSWDPKETWALITWFIFAVYLHTRVTIGWSGKKPALMATFGFITVWICYLGVNLLGKGLHSYGWLNN